MEPLGSKAPWVKLADDLERHIKGDLSVEQFREQHAASDWESDFGLVLSNIDHFLDDRDIRAKDSWYAEMQHAEMKKLIQKLRDGASVSELRGISFLEKSDDA